jgi:hypothetical protein
MQFLHPAFLFALGALAIPVIIHLFNFRRFKTVYFSNVSFLKEIKEETSSRIACEAPARSRYEDARNHISGFGLCAAIYP